MPPTIYHNPRCSKSRATLELLESRGLKPRVVEYLKDPPSAAELKKIVGLLGVKAHDIVRKAEAAEAGIKPGELNETALIAAMAQHPAIIERPIVINSAKAALGRPPENVLKIL
jgi:arsenate reductase